MRGAFGRHETSLGILGRPSKVPGCPRIYHKVQHTLNLTKARIKKVRTDKIEISLNNNAIIIRLSLYVYIQSEKFHFTSFNDVKINFLLSS